jgi:hypothetical protein
MTLLKSQYPEPFKIATSCLDDDGAGILEARDIATRGIHRAPSRFGASRMRTTHSHIASKAQVGMFAEILDFEGRGSRRLPLFGWLG